MGERDPRRRARRQRPVRRARRVAAPRLGARRERAGSARAGRWLVAAALAFGLGIGAHPLVGLARLRDRRLAVRRRPTHLAPVAAGGGVRGRDRRSAYRQLRIHLGARHRRIRSRRSSTPTPTPGSDSATSSSPSSSRDLFARLPRAAVGLLEKFRLDARRVLAAQFSRPAGCSSPSARRSWPSAALEDVRRALPLRRRNVLYSMNFRDGDIDRYYMPTIVVLAPLIGVAVAPSAATRALGPRRRWAGVLLRGEPASRRRGSRPLRRRSWSWRSGRALPSAALVTGYEAHDQSANRDADDWVASVHAQLPPNAVVISWWSYSTPLGTTAGSSGSGRT